jgi:hypothetical protein
MDIIYTWSITNLESLRENGAFDGYVIQAYYTFTGESDFHKANVTGVVDFKVNSEQLSYTPYSSLTEADVITWVKAALGDMVNMFENDIALRIQDQITPIYSSLPLPWAVNGV